jgi:hypothetical protein
MLSAAGNLTKKPFNLSLTQKSHIDVLIVFQLINVLDIP